MYSTYLLALGQRKQRGSQTPALRPSWRTVELSFPQVLGVRSECRFVENAVAVRSGGAYARPKRSLQCRSWNSGGRGFSVSVDLGVGMSNNCFGARSSFDSAET